jgi:5-methylcytosine-specific restriction enzyme subunit McrC
MLYASDLTRIGGAFNAVTDDDIDDLPDLIARLMVNSVERRLRRNLTRGYAIGRWFSRECAGASTS